MAWLLSLVMFFCISLTENRKPKVGYLIFNFVFNLIFDIGFLLRLRRSFKYFFSDHIQTFTISFKLSSFNYYQNYEGLGTLHLDQQTTINHVYSYDYLLNFDWLISYNN